MAAKHGVGVPTREIILREASKLFAERGYHGTSTRDIALAVGVRQPSLFHHFATKNEIMAELQGLEFAASLEVFQVATSSPGSAAARLYFAIYIEVRQLLGSTLDFTGTTTAAVLNDPAFAAGSQANERLRTAQTELIAEGVTSGELIPIDPAIASRAVDWTIEGVLVDATRHPDDDPEKFAELLAAYAVRSLLADTDRLDDVRGEAMQLVATYADAGAFPSARP